VLAASFLAGDAMGSSLQSNPVTPLGIVSKLIPKRHPACGTQIKGKPLAEVLLKYDPSKRFADSLKIISTVRNGIKKTSTRTLRHMETTTGTDVDTLEGYFNEPMERNFNVIQSQYASGASPTAPWPGSYWPTYQDGINVVWKSGEPSASEKYAQAFGKDVKQFQDAISERSGIDGQWDHPVCSTNSGCQSLGDGSVCAIRAGKSSGYCIPTWYGICHAWSPASEWEPEPKCPTVKNGVIFRPRDIKALLSQVYNDAYVDVVFLGARFDGPDYPLDLDRYNRFNDAARRDLGPGLFHIALTNIMGKHSQGFILDVTAGSEVWNQPVRGYEIIESSLVNATEASITYYGTNSYPFNTDMKHLAHTRTRVSWVVESNEDRELVATGRVDAYTTTVEYEYFLELDANHNIIGGEWLGNSNTEHPDFLWFVTARPPIDTVTDMDMDYKEIRGILDASIACLNVPSELPTPAPETTPTPPKDKTPGTK
jgi:hypothetical protein